MSERAGQVAIVTGAGRGVGQAVAVALARQGVRVCVADQNPDRADNTAALIRAEDGECFAWQVDVSNKFQVSAMIEQTRDRYERLDMLVHNAHIQPRKALLKMDEWDWRRVIEVNLTGAFYCGQLAGRVMADEGGGAIVYVLRDGGEEEGAFGASQAGLEGLVAHLAREVAGQKVHVQAVSASPSQDETLNQLLAYCGVGENE